MKWPSLIAKNGKKYIFGSRFQRYNCLPNKDLISLDIALIVIYKKYLGISPQWTLQTVTFFVLFSNHIANKHFVARKFTSNHE